MLDVTPSLGPERRALVELLRSLDSDQWARPTECPEWNVKGVALHILGDDLSLISRQRDDAENGVLLFALQNPGLSFLDLLNGFNEKWVSAAGFLSGRVLVDLLDLSGGWTEDFYRGVNPADPGEAVGFFGSQTDPSPWWQVSAREYAERWIHHSQIRRALGLSPVNEELTAPAVDALVEGIGARNKQLRSFEIGDRAWTFREVGMPVALRTEAALQVLSRALPYEQTVDAMTGDHELVASIADQTCQNYGTRQTTGG